MNNLAEVLMLQGRFAEAEKMQQETLTAGERVEHPDTLKSRDNLANVLNQRGNHEQAEEIYREALTVMQKVLSKEHPDTLSNMSILALALSRQGKYEQAEERKLGSYHRLCTVVGLSKDLETGHLEVDFILWALLPYFEKWQQSNCQAVCPERYTYNSYDSTHHAPSRPATLAMEHRSPMINLRLNQELGTKLMQLRTLLHSLSKRISRTKCHCRRIEEIPGSRRPRSFFGLRTAAMEKNGKIRFPVMGALSKIVIESTV